MKKYVTEFIGTFFLVFVIGFTTSQPWVGGTPFAPLAIGAILMVMVYMGGPISGGFYNPAVTLAALIRKKIETKEALIYMLFQVMGAFAAAFTFWFTYKVIMGSPAPMHGFRYNFKPVLLESICTFALASVVLNVATSKKSGGNSYFGLAIGFTVGACAFAVGSVTGGAFNPAVALGPMLMDTLMGGNAIQYLWIYLVGPFTGAIVAGLVYRIMNPDEE